MATLAITKPPPGFVIDSSAPAPPPGFVIDAQTVTSPPVGFVPDQQPAVASSIAPTMTEASPAAQAYRFQEGPAVPVTKPAMPTDPTAGVGMTGPLALGIPPGDLAANVPKKAPLPSASALLYAQSQKKQPPKEIEKELIGVLEPWMQPTDVFTAGAGAGTKLALAGGKKLFPAMLRGVLAGTTGTAMEYPIGHTADLLEEDYENPELAFLFAVGVGLASGLTIENLADKKILDLSRRIASKYLSNPKVATIANALGIDTAAAKTAQAKQTAAGTFEKMKQAPAPDPETAKIQTEGAADVIDLEEDIRKAAAGDVDHFKKQLADLKRPKGPDAYFEKTPESQDVSLDELVPSELEAGIDQAKKRRGAAFQKRAADGKIEKRKPLAIYRRQDGKLIILDGNTTYYNLKTSGESAARVEVKKSIRQPKVRSMRHLYQDAEGALEDHRKLTEEWAKEFGGEAKFRPGGDPFKSRASVERKAAEENDYDVSRIKDVLASTVVFDTEEQAVSAGRKLQDRVGVVEFKDRWAEPLDSGYRDYALNVRHPNGHISEIQLTTKGMFDAKIKGPGHQLYEVLRGLYDVAKRAEIEGDSGLYGEALRFVDKMNGVSRSFYGSAQKDAESSLALSSEMVRELTMIWEKLSGSVTSLRLAPASKNSLQALLSNSNTLSSFSRKIDSDIANPPLSKDNIAPERVKVKAFGAENKLFLPGQKEQSPIHFALMETSDVLPSHDPITFSKKAGYPEGVQERMYHKDKAEQWKVISHEQKLKTNLLLNTNPDATNGPPIVTPEGIVLGGNSRAMSIQRAYIKQSKGLKYKEKLAQFAEQFGLTREQVEAMNEPILVRVYDPGTDDAKELHRVASSMNQPPTQEMTVEAKAASMGKNVSKATLENIGDRLLDGDATIRSLLDKNDGIDILDRLIKDNVIPETNRNRYINPKYNQLNKAGKDVIEDMLLGSVLDDPDLLDAMSGYKSYLNKIGSSLSPLARIQSRGEAWDISGDLKGAADHFLRMQSGGFKSVDEYINQRALPGQEFDLPGKKEERILRALLEDNQRKFSDRWKGYSRDAAADAKKQSMLFKPKSPKESFVDHFGGELEKKSGQAVVKEGSADYLSQSEEWQNVQDAKKAFKQTAFEFKKREISPIGGDRDVSVASRVRMETTGRLPFHSPKVDSAGDAASLVSHIGNDAQENLYIIAVDKNDKILEVHRYSRGTRGSSQVSMVETAGRTFNVPGTKKVYAVHNHPGLSTFPSGPDLGLFSEMGKVLKLRDIELEPVIIGGDKYATFRAGVPQVTPPAGKNLEIPQVERRVPIEKAKETDLESSIMSEKDARIYAQNVEPGKGGMILLNAQNKPVGFVAEPPNATERGMTREIIAASERQNATAGIYYTPGKMTPTKENYARLLADALTGEVHVHDIIDDVASLRTNKLYTPQTDLTKPKVSFETFDSSNLINLHPSTITGPIGGAAAGVDWEEYEKTGNVKIDPKKALFGAIVGAASPVGYKKAKAGYQALASWWDDKAGEIIVDPLKTWANGKITGEETRFWLGLNRSSKFKDVLRDHYRDVEHVWNKAAELGQELRKLAPTQLEQKRLMQVVRGGITASKDMQAKAAKVNELFAGLRADLEKYKLLEYSRFDKITRKERAELRNIIAKDKSTKAIEEEEFYKLHPEIPQVPTRSATDPPEWATEEIPVSAYDQSPKTEAEWARQKLHDHYHFATAEEYAPIYYDSKEGLSPKQKDILADEIRRLKLKSRRGNPEGNPQLEDMIARMEKMLGKGRQARAEMRKARAQLNKEYSHRRLEIPYEVQKMMGLIEEAAYPVAKMVGVQGSDVLKAKLFKHISEIPAWAMPAKQGKHVEYPANFVEVKGEAFGELDGMWVRRDIWDDLKEVEDMRSAIGRNYDKLMGYWKAGKVIFNPSTHARNFMSNAILAYLGDVHPGDVKTYKKAFKAITRKGTDKFYKEAEDWGLFNNTFVTAEISKLRDELDSLRDVGKLRSWIRTAASAPATLYEENEKLFKMAVFIKARESGMEVDAAARKAEKFLFNYGDIPPWVKQTKRWVSPFMTFTYKAIPLAAEMTIRKPVKMAAIAGLMYGTQQFAQSQLGYTDDEAMRQRELLPDWQKSKAPPGIGPYTHILMPFRDKWGNDLYFDTSYILPWGNIGEKWGQSGMPLSDLLGPSPLLGIAAGVIANRNTFSGKDIYNEVLDGATARVQKQLEYVWRELAPPLAPGGSNFNKIKTGFKNSFMGKDVRDWADRPVEFQTAILSTLLGIKLSPVNEKKLEEFEMTTRRRIGSEVDKEIGKLKGKHRRNEITKDELSKQARDLKELKKKLLMDRPKKIN